jgi:hypothetical protein
VTSPREALGLAAVGAATLGKATPEIDLEVLRDRESCRSVASPSRLRRQRKKQTLCAGT